MSETIKITPGLGLLIKYNGVFDFDKLYKEMHEWFVGYGYGFNEKEQTKKFGDLGAKVEFKWSGDRKIDDYAQYTIEVHTLIEEMNKAEKLDSGKLSIEITASLILDYKNKWQANPVRNFFFKIYNRVILKDKINKYYIGKLYEESINLQDTIKSILGLYS
jgi:hypothetical protein